MAVLFKMDDPLLHLRADGALGLLELFIGRHELLRGEEGEDGVVVEDVAGERVKAGDALDLVAEEFEADALLVEVRGAHFHDIAAHAEAAALKGHVVALVEHVDQLREHALAADLLPDFHGEEHFQIVLRRGQAVDARDAGDDDHVLAREQRRRGGKAQALDLLVDRGIFLDVGVAARDVGLGLVVVEVAHKILDGVAREELLELRVELRGQRLVVRHHESGLADIAQHIRSGEGLARAGHAEQRLVPVAREDGLGQLGDRLRLVALGGVVGGEFKRHPADVAGDAPEGKWAGGNSGETAAGGGCGALLGHAARPPRALAGNLFGRGQACSARMAAIARRQLR